MKIFIPILSNIAPVKTLFIEFEKKLFILLYMNENNEVVALNMMTGANVG
jgi:hypothetical protein